MTILSRLLARRIGLPPAETDDVEVERDLRVSMPDGAVLLADRYAPGGRGQHPLLLVRSPYGRRGLWGQVYGRLLAERGFQLLIQSCRGTFGPGGRFDPMGTERQDGLATIEWLRRQPWYPGEFATLGPSCCGFAQWAIAADSGPEHRAVAAQYAASELGGLLYAGGAYSLETALSWTLQTATQERPLGWLYLVGINRRLRRKFRHLPLWEPDRLVGDQHVPHFQEWLQHDDPCGPYWRHRAFDHTVAQVTAPVYLIGGWYDIMLPWQLRDYTALRAAGRQPHLTIGPWGHSDEVFTGGAGEYLAWLQANLPGNRGRLRAEPVRVFVTGSEAWRDLPWCPPATRRQRWQLQTGGGLAPRAPASSGPDQYIYDPADPTPSVAGPMLLGKAVPRDNRRLEARPDVQPACLSRWRPPVRHCPAGRQLTADLDAVFLRPITTCTAGINAVG